MAQNIKSICVRATVATCNKPFLNFENRLPLMAKRYKIGGYSSDNDSFCITTVFFGTIITE